MFSITESAFAFLTVTVSLPASSENLKTNPTICPFTIFDELLCRPFILLYRTLICHVDYPPLGAILARVIPNCQSEISNCTTTRLTRYLTRPLRLR